MSAVIELNEKEEIVSANGDNSRTNKPYLFTVKVYDAMIKHGILTENDDVELLNGIIFEKYTAKPYLISVKIYDAMIENGLIDENDRLELLNGEIIEKMPKGTKHTSITTQITKFFYRNLSDEFTIRIQDPIWLDGVSEPEPDVVLAVSDENNYSERHPGPEEILAIIEVSDSTLRYDRDRKGPAYSRAGIRQYLIVNVENNSIEDHQNPAEDGYQTKRTLKIGDNFSLNAFPEIEIKVEEFLQN